MLNFSCIAADIDSESLRYE